MTPERWKRTEDLYHAARARAPGERAAFLAEACPDDEVLRGDVESLLNEPTSAEGFLAKPAVAMSPHLLSDLPPAAMAGRLLGGYRLQALIGAGGMGEVYRARDQRLERDVAIKILPHAFTSDPDRLARFEREARMLASLNHPNICGIYGIEESDGIRFLILELVEGETLAARLATAPRLRSGDAGLSPPVALTSARQIAEALEAAHERGIIHRDLKPANVKITPDGVVKILDFGLAKIVVGGQSTPGLTHPGGTREGAVIGTAAYMSPEQARGLPVDRRTDIWAFGCVLYEMLTGHAAFAGDTASDSIAKILETEPDWSALPAAVPTRVRSLIVRSLEKDPLQRLRDIGEARIALQEPAAPEADAALEKTAPVWRSHMPAARLRSRTSFARRSTLPRARASGSSAAKPARSRSRPTADRSPSSRGLRLAVTSCSCGRWTGSSPDRCRALRGQPGHSGRRTDGSSVSLPTRNSRK
jgi:serine/threonine protein kinase